MTPYSHQEASSRAALATLLTQNLESKGFRKVSNSGEDVWEFTPRQTDHQRGRVVFVVYSSIVHGQVREVGADAMRAVAIYRVLGSKDRPLAKESRVNRTGVVEEIVDRVFQRCRLVAQAVKGAERCRQCGSPTFLSKSNKPTCAAICWEST